MSSKPSTRLARLDLILTQSPPNAAGLAGDGDPDQVHLASVPLERIHGLTDELRERSDGSNDALDGITMRLLLNDYKAAVAHLRAVTNSVDARLHAVSGELNHLRKTLHRGGKMVAKRTAELKALEDATSGAAPEEELDATIRAAAPRPT